MRLNDLIPMLNVSDIESSLDFYRRALGFEIVSDPGVVKEWRWATIRSGDTELMLAETEHDPGLSRDSDPQHDISWPCLFYFYPDDVNSLHAHVEQQGFKPTPLQTTFYGMTEFSLRDPDGHALSFGQDLEA